jgi:hypothetical protein
MSNSTNLHITKLEVGQAQKEASINEAIDALDGGIAGYTTKSVAGSSNIELSASEARARVIHLTGVLTGSINVDLPSISAIGSSREVIVYNNTSGAFNLTLRYNGGTGVVLLQGYAQRCYHNGTNLYAAGDPFVPATSVTAGSAWTSFTPTLRFGGGSTGITYTTQLGRYTRVGNLVAFNIVLILTSKGSSTGSATIAGLPVSASGTANGFQVGYVRINFGTFTGTSTTTSTRPALPY